MNDEFDLTSVTVEDGALVGRYDVSEPGRNIRVALACELSGEETGAIFELKIKALRTEIKSMLRGYGMLVDGVQP